MLQRTVNDNLAHTRRGFACKRNAISALVLVCLSMCDVNGQTCIVIRRTPRSIVVAADSKEVHYTVFTDFRGQRQTSQQASLKCKIRQVDALTFYAVSGQYNFDVDALAVDSCRNGGAAFLGKVTAFEQAVHGLLIKHLEELKERVPDLYNQNYISVRKPALQIVIFGIENSIPAFVTLSLHVTSGYAYVPSGLIIDPFRINEPVTLAASIDGCPLKRLAKESMMRALGRTEVIDGIDWLENKFWKWFGDVDGVRFLVRLETLAAPENVGDPIDVLYIDAKGCRWIDHKTECAELQQPSPPKLAKPQPQRRKHG